MSHVVVFNSSAKTVKIVTTPVKYLSEIRDEACQKFHVNKDQYTLKYNNKPIALSQQIRLAGLAQGARLELVQASRSPTVISVAVQLPATENSVRLTNKFASNISLWEILRYLENEQSSNYNFTQRGVPELNTNGKSGAGRLNYESPVITVMPGHREYSSLSDLQKTLSQLGFDSGSALLRLSFKNSGKPLEEAMAEISQFFKSSGSTPNDTPAATSTQTTSVPVAENDGPGNAETTIKEKVKEEDVSDSHMDIDSIPALAPVPAASDDTQEKDTAASPPTSSTPVSPPTAVSSGPPASSEIRKKQIYSAPSGATPQAALQTYNEADYVPSIDHARSHQASLQSRGKNTRLLSDKELEEQENARLEKLNVVAEKGSVVQVRLPDSQRVEIRIDKSNTAADLYQEVEDVIQFKDPFNLQRRADTGQQVIIPRDAKRLILDLGFRNSELVTFTWDERASNAARTSQSFLKPEWQAQAKTLQIADPVERKPDPVPQQTKAEGKKKAGSSGADKESKLKSLMNRHLFKK